MNEPENEPPPEQPDQVVYDDDHDDLDLRELGNEPIHEETILERLQKAAKRGTTKVQIKNWHDTPVNVTPSGRHEIIEEPEDDSDISVDDAPPAAGDATGEAAAHEVVEDAGTDLGDLSDLDEATLGGSHEDELTDAPGRQSAGAEATDAPVVDTPVVEEAAGEYTPAGEESGPATAEGLAGSDAEHAVAEPGEETAAEADAAVADESPAAAEVPAAESASAYGASNDEGSEWQSNELPEDPSDRTAEYPPPPEVLEKWVSAANAHHEQEVAAAGPATVIGDALDVAGYAPAPDISAGPMTQAAFEMQLGDSGASASMDQDVQSAAEDVAEPERQADSGPDQLPAGANGQPLLDNAASSEVEAAAAAEAPGEESPDAREGLAKAGPEPQQETDAGEVRFETVSAGDDTAESGSSGLQHPEGFTVADESGAPLGRGLDVGTANLVAAKMDEEGSIEFFPARNAFLDIPEDPYTLKMLKGQGVPFIKRENKLYVIGEDAFELANIFNREMRRPMKNGLISPTDADAMPMEVELFKKILGPPRAEGEVVYYSIPADPVDSTLNIVYHTNIANGLLERLGYKGTPFNEGQAIVFSELGDDDFTGIGISCGGGMVNVCVAFRSMNVISFSTAKGGDWIDQQAAQVMGCAASKITAIKERGVDINAPKTPEEEAIVIYYRHLIKYSLDNIAKKFALTKDIPNFPKPVPIAISGGTSKVGGFVEVFKDEFSKMANKFPIKISDIRRAEDQLNATAKGCLLAALSHEE
ncbi:MAG: hypothetical protein IT463_11550 [Planctomycetes bacterium]|nr:hypothetical protein [Planctomycetota bacterium]